MANKNYKHNFFTAKGVDISSPKSMWNFLHDHYTYDTMNSWNGLKSIANNVKLYGLQLEGDPYTALSFLNDEEYATVNSMIRDWDNEHPGYVVGFNGRSGGYLVVYNKKNNKSILPNELFDFDTYEDCLEYLHSYTDTISNHKHDLRELTELVRDFDELCNDLRDYVNDLSKQNFADCKLIDLIIQFNFIYARDLKTLGYNDLEVKDGKVDVTQICNIAALFHCLQKLVQDVDGYKMMTSSTNTNSWFWLEAR